jgi:hypothetical protein
MFPEKAEAYREAERRWRELEGRAAANETQRVRAVAPEI